jgi:hypothetical protein
MPNKANAQEQIAQLAIDIPALQPYLHPEAPGRKPLKVLLGGGASKDWKLNKFDAPVQYVEKGDPKKVPLLEFVALEVTGDTAATMLRYAIEGIQLKASFARNASGVWQLASHTIVER